MPTGCVKKYVDCSKLGGYDPSDRCKQTCLHKTSNSLNTCKDNCKSNAKRIAGSDLTKEKTLYYECAGKCEGVTSVCNKRYVDCSRYGGYDPNDKCRQTCLKKEIAFDKDSCATRCKSDVKNMKFRTDADQAKWLDICVDKCTSTVEQPVAVARSAVALVSYKSAAVPDME
jgi:hypothetical protein